MGDSNRTVILKDEALRSLKGFTQIPNVVLKDASISFGAKVAFAVLLSYAWQSDFCYPAQDRLASDLNCSVRQVRRLLSELKDGHFIDWKQQGLNKTNVYYILSRSDWAPPNPSIRKDRTHLSPPDRTSVSRLGRPKASDRIDSEKNTRSVNVNAVSDHQEANSLPEAGLVFEMIDSLGDRHSTSFYRRVARLVPEGVIFEALAEVKYQANMRRIRKNRGAAFTDLIKRRAQELGIDLCPASPSSDARGP